MPKSKIAVVVNPSVELGDYVKRHAESISCECGGYADSVDCTKQEIKKYDCSRGGGCCSRAFVCRVCGQRMVGTAEAPEME